jgi:hypothetical protein
LPGDQQDIVAHLVNECRIAEPECEIAYQARCIATVEGLKGQGIASRYPADERVIFDVMRCYAT